MTPQTLLDIAPLVACLAVAVFGLRLLASGVRGGPRWSELARLHRDERGAVQSLSFVLTIPAYVMLILFIVQVSQLTIAKVVVEYAAYTAARSASVWIPASLGADSEAENQVSNLVYAGEETDANGVRYSVYRLAPGGPKYERIRYAAVAAALAIAPSRSTGVALPPEAAPALESLQRAYLATAPGQAANPRIAARLRNKLAYAWQHTQIEVTIRHRESEPPLQVVYDVPPRRAEFAPGEVGWNDQVQVRVLHAFALLPGPGRFLARPVVGTSGSTGGSTTPAVDRVAATIERRGDQYVYPVAASATLHLEGEKPLLPFIHEELGPLRLGSGGRSGGMSRPISSGGDRSSDAWSLLPLRPAPPLTADEELCCDERTAPPRRTLSPESGPAPTPARPETRP